MSENKLPVIVGQELKPDPLPIQVYQSVFRFTVQNFIDLETQRTVKGKLWKFVCNNPMNSIYRNGRPRFGESKRYKIRTVSGEIVERESRETKGKVFGYQALADALSTRFPITPEKVQEMIEKAITRNDSHVKFVLISDLVPTSIDRFSGKNGWKLISDYPSTDKIYQKINKALKASGSSLRIEAGLKTKIIEV
ncbi:MAG: hypothetical protein IBV52_09690 [Candidatus Bathyarchaeota archaeon]